MSKANLEEAASEMLAPAHKLELVARAEQAPPPRPEPAAQMTEPATPERKPSRGLRKFALPVVVAGAISLGAWYGHGWWTDGRFLVSTDDAYVGADMAVLSPKVTGYVQSVPVRDNEPVKAGDPIVVIDPGDYDLSLRAAEAKITVQTASVERIRAQRAASLEQVSEAEANRTAMQAASIRRPSIFVGRKASSSPVRERRRRSIWRAPRMLKPTRALPEPTLP